MFQHRRSMLHPMDRVWLVQAGAALVFALLFGLGTAKAAFAQFELSNPAPDANALDIDVTENVAATFNLPLGTSAVSEAGEGRFIPHPTTPSFGDGSDSYDIALGDIDGDDDLDALMATYGGLITETETVWLNDGTGTFAPHPTASAFWGFRPNMAVELGDLDGDGDLDTVLANSSGFTSTVWLNNGAGVFTAHPTTPGFESGESFDVKLGDLDGDGDLDAFMANDGAATVWLNDGTGAFTPHPTTPSVGDISSYSIGVALGDIDGDGDLDALLPDSPPLAEPGKPVTVWVNDGTGAFTPHPTTPTYGDGSNSQIVALGDLDGDGDLDTLATDIVSLAAAVWVNDGTGVFTPHPTTPIFGETFPTDAALGDLDGDGDLDALLANFLGDETVWLNDGEGNFTARSNMPRFNGEVASNKVVLGDIDGDGDLDALFANLFEKAETVWLNVPSMELTAHSPDANALDVAVTANVAATFDRLLDASTVGLQTFIVRGSQTAVYTGPFTFPTGDALSFNPTNNFKPGEEIQVTANSGIENSSTLLLQPYIWQFTAAVSGSGSGIFIPQPTKPNFGAGSDSYDVMLGDLDGDGDLDALVANYSFSETVWLNDGMGIFTSHPTTPDFGTNGPNTDVALGDIDGDGDLDAIVANENPGETVWLNDGSGSFTPHPVEPIFGVVSLTPDLYSDVELGDIDGDGDLDAIVANNNLTTVWLNSGSGTFTPHPNVIYLGDIGEASSNAVALGDIDGDGDLDALVANAEDVAETVWVNNGTGTFTPHPTTPSFESGDSRDVTLGDIDGDGDLDALLANENLPTTVWVNNGSGVFTKHPIAATFGADASSAVALGDIDGDGDLDALVANDDNQAETVWLNNGSGVFTKHPIAATFGADASSAVALGDIDGDGDLDALVANKNNQAETVWLNYSIDGAVTKGQSSATAQPGQPITYTLVVDNLSAPLSTGTKLEDIVPETIGNLAFVADGIVVVPTAGLSYRWDVGPMLIGATGVVTITGVVSPGLTSPVEVVNTARLIISGDTVLANNNSETVLTIDVPTVQFSIATYSSVEGDAVQITVTLDEANPYAPVIVALTTSNGTALADEDYVTQAATLLTVPVGQTSAAFALPTVQDALFEEGETLSVTMEVVAGSQLGAQQQATVTIADDDEPPQESGRLYLPSVTGD